MASSANFWMIHTLHFDNCFVQGVIRLLKNLVKIQYVHVGFVKFLPTEFAVCLKPPSRDIHREAFYPRALQCDQGGG